MPNSRGFAAKLRLETGSNDVRNRPSCTRDCAAVGPHHAGLMKDVEGGAAAHNKKNCGWA
jgi:hypothetical protein